MRADFYHLTVRPLDRVLPAICERVYGLGERLVMVADDGALLDRIDQLLWTFKAESFLPHGRATGGAEDAGQPVLLVLPDQLPTAGAAANIALIDGVWRDVALAYDRAFYLFDADTIASARDAWRALADADGVERHYWKQDDDGKWREGP